MLWHYPVYEDFDIEKTRQLANRDVWIGSPQDDIEYIKKLQKILLKICNDIEMMRLEKECDEIISHNEIMDSIQGKLIPKKRFF